MSPIQALPSFTLALHPDHHYTTVLPNISFPSRPSAHIPWSGPSPPLVFSVSQTISSSFLLQPYFFLARRELRVQRLQLLALAFKFVILSFDLILTLTYTLHQFQILTPDTCQVPGAFYGVGTLIWVRLIGVLRAFVFWLLFLVAQLVKNHSKTQGDQAKAFRRIVPRVPLSPTGPWSSVSFPFC